MIEPNDLFVACGLTGQPITPCRVIDAHAHLGEILVFPVPDNTVEAVVRAMDRVGVAEYWCSSTPGVHGDAERGNRQIAEAMQRYPGRICGWAAADVGYPEKAVRQLEWCRAAGFRGLKIYSSAARPGLEYNEARYKVIYDFAHAHQLPILAHTWGKGDLEALRPAIEKYADVNFLLAHTGSQDKPHYLEFGRRYPNAYLELCLSWAPRGLVEEFVAAGLEDKLIWGSDSTFLDFKQQIGRVLFARVTSGQKEKILGGNAQKILQRVDHG